MAFNYGGRAEIVDAVRDLVADGVKPEKVTEKAIRSHLYFPDQPDPDLVIRTSGEHRVSNFLLWQLAYSELVFDRGAVAGLPPHPPVRRRARLPAPPTPLRGRHLMAPPGRGRLTGPDHVTRRRRRGLDRDRLGASACLVYAGVVLAWHAGFTAAAPFVVIPAVLVDHDRRRQPAERPAPGPPGAPVQPARPGAAAHRSASGGPPARRAPAPQPTARRDRTRRRDGSTRSGGARTGP